MGDDAPGTEISENVPPAAHDDDEAAPLKAEPAPEAEPTEQPDMQRDVVPQPQPQPQGLRHCFGDSCCDGGCCTWEGDSGLATALKLFLLGAVFVHMIGVGVKATQAGSSGPCSLDGSDGGIDACCLSLTDVAPGTPSHDMISAAHACGLWTIVESVAVRLSAAAPFASSFESFPEEAAQLVVFVCPHIMYMMETHQGGGGGMLGDLSCCNEFFKGASGAAAVCGTCCVGIPALVFLVLLRTEFSDISEACDGDEEWSVLEDEVVWPLTVIHSVITLAAVCAPFFLAQLWNALLRR